MLIIGDLLSHRKIKDLIYKVEKLDTTAGMAYIVATNGAGEGLWIHFSDVGKKYRRVNK